MKIAAFVLLCLLAVGAWSVIPATTTPTADAVAPLWEPMTDASRFESMIPADDDCLWKGLVKENLDPANVSNLSWGTTYATDNTNGKVVEGDICCMDFGISKTANIVLNIDGEVDFEEALNCANPPPLPAAERFIIFAEVKRVCGGVSMGSSVIWWPGWGGDSYEITDTDIGPLTHKLDQPEPDCDCELIITIGAVGFYENPNPPGNMIQLPNEALLMKFTQACNPGGC